MMSLVSNLDDIKNIADKIVQFLKEGKHILMFGGLGAGKTTLTSSVISQISDNENVSSPTYSIVQEYETNIGLISHLDLYRIKNSDELLDIGFEDILYNNPCIIEWPEIGLDYIENAIKIDIEVLNDYERKYIITSID